MVYFSQHFFSDRKKKTLDYTVDPEIFIGQNFRILIFRVVKFSWIDLMVLYLLNKVIISCVKFSPFGGSNENILTTKVSGSTVAFGFSQI